MSIKTLTPIEEYHSYYHFIKPYWSLETEEKLEVLRLKFNEIIEALQEDK